MKKTNAMNSCMQKSPSTGIVRKRNQDHRAGAPVVAACLRAALTLASGSAVAASVTNFANIDVPGATKSIANDVNNAGVIVGRFDDATGTHGFIRAVGGTITTVDYPGVAGNTVILGINDAGQVVGRYALGGVQHGFLLSNGVYTPIDFPGASYTHCHGINRSGQIVGRIYYPKNPGQGGGGGQQHEHGFLYSNGLYTSLDYPNANTTDAWKITDDGNIVGDWSDNGALQSGSVHGYVVQGGQFISQDLPGAVITASRDMNVVGQVVGVYWDKKYSDHGFLLENGIYTSFDYPGSAATDGDALNDTGTIVGFYEDAAGADHAFMASIDSD